MGGTNFIGPGPDKDPYRIGLNPIDAIDRAAQMHDYEYWKAGAGGIGGALFNSKVFEADQKLASDAISIMNAYKAGGIDTVTGLPISQRTYNLATAVTTAFTIIIAESILHRLNNVVK
jgi:hypothetical protein